MIIRTGIKLQALKGFLRFIAVPLIITCAFYFNTFLSYLNSYPVSKFYYLLLIGIISLLCLLFAILKQNKIAVYHIDLILLLYGVIIVFSNIRHRTITLNESSQCLAQCALFYLICRITIRGMNHLVRCGAFLTIIFCLEFSVFLVQLSTRYDRVLDVNSLALTGTLENSGLFAGLMVSLFPFVSWWISKLSGKVLRKLMVLLSTICMVSIIIFTQSRSGFYAFTLTLFLLNTNSIAQWYYRVDLHKRIAVITVCIFSIITISGLLYHIKVRSAEGRNLIWTVTLEHGLDKPVLGIGYGNFPQLYNYWQGEHFNKKTGDSALTRSVASLSFIAFCEPLQIFIETGAMGLIAYLLIIVLVVRNFLKKGIHSNTEPYLISILSVFIFSFFSYPYHCVPIILLTILCLSALVVNAVPVKFWRINNGFRVALIALLTCCFRPLVLFQVKELKAVGRWNEIQESSEFNGRDLAPFYRGLDKQLAIIPLFRYEFGVYLYNTKKYREAIQILEENGRNLPDIETLLTLGKCYDEVGNFGQAENSFKIASEIIPSNLQSRYLLIKLYLKHGNRLKGVQLANEFLKMPVKVNSPAADEMKNEIADSIKLNQKSN
jgi:O-antigen polymerase